MPLNTLRSHIFAYIVYADQIAHTHTWARADGEWESENTMKNSILCRVCWTIFFLLHAKLFEVSAEMRSRSLVIIHNFYFFSLTRRHCVCAIQSYFLFSVEFCMFMIIYRLYIYSLLFLVFILFLRSSLVVLALLYGFCSIYNFDIFFSLLAHLFSLTLVCVFVFACLTSASFVCVYADSSSAPNCTCQFLRIQFSECIENIYRKTPKQKQMKHNSFLVCAICFDLVEYIHSYIVVVFCRWCCCCRWYFFSPIESVCPSTKILYV